ncbi:MAG: radical SAM protein, partial [Lachnospiraceae bacterium]|nr:radical SAM protein [Lachnospiraceae bacterium]
MYIKLIQPKMIKRPMDTDLKLHMAPPLGLLTIVNLFRKEHVVSLENENIQSINYTDNPDIVGISVTVDTLPGAIRIAKKFRDMGIIVVAGGIHITTAYDTIPKDVFDVLCIGAAEGTWPDIIKDFEKGTLKSVYKCHKDFNGKDIVPPAYDFLTEDQYLYCNVIHTSRGCPFRCDFCYNSAGRRMYVNRDIEAVLQDIKAVNSKHIMFIDDNFAGNQAWLRDLLNKLIPMDIKWNAAVSLNALCDADMLDLMKRSGCQGLFVGFESIQEDSINNVHKIQNNIEIYEKAVKMAHDRGIMI